MVAVAEESKVRSVQRFSLRVLAFLASKGTVFFNNTTVTSKSTESYANLIAQKGGLRCIVSLSSNSEDEVTLLYISKLLSKLLRNGTLTLLFICPILNLLQQLM
jgi:hypothetical protein